MSGPVSTSNHINLPKDHSLRHSSLFDTALKIEASYDTFCSALPSEVVKGDKTSFILIPREVEQVQTILGVANMLASSGLLPACLVPISQDKNWGYKVGIERGILLNLGELREIKVVNKELGLVAVQPGVTQFELWNFIREELDNKFIPPTTNAGPSTSVLGNILERGFGLLPNNAHFRELEDMTIYPGDGSNPVILNCINYANEISMQHGAILGEEGFQYLQEAQAMRRLRDHSNIMQSIAESHYRGSYGVVTSVEIALRPRREYFGILTFDVPREEDGTKVYQLLKSIYRDSFYARSVQDENPSFHAVSISDRTRQLPLVMDFPQDIADINKPLDQNTLIDICREKKIPPWQVTISLSCPGYLEVQLKIILEQIKKRVGLHCNNFQISFYENSNREIEFAKESQEFFKLVNELGYEISFKPEEMLGYPDELSLRTAYWRTDGEIPKEDLDPGRDGCGIRWGKFLGPDESVEKMVSIIQELYPLYGFDPMIRIFSCEQRAAYMLAPMTYLNSKEAHDRSRECFLKVYEAAEQIGFLPHGLPYDTPSQFDVQNHYLDQIAAYHEPTNLNAVPFPHPVFPERNIFVAGADISHALQMKRLLKVFDPQQVLTKPAPWFSKWR